MEMVPILVHPVVFEIWLRLPAVISLACNALADTVMLESVETDEPLVSFPFRLTTTEPPGFSDWLVEGSSETDAMASLQLSVPPLPPLAVTLT